MTRARIDGFAAAQVAYDNEEAFETRGEGANPLIQYRCYVCHAIKMQHANTMALHLHGKAICNDCAALRPLKQRMEEEGD